MMNINEITTWAQAPENQDHPMYAQVMSELGLINLMRDQMHDHETLDSLRTMFNNSDPQSQQIICKQIARETSQPVLFKVGEDQGDEFYANMLVTMKSLIKKRDRTAPVGMVIEDNRLMCVFCLQVWTKIKLSIQACNFYIEHNVWQESRGNHVAETVDKILNQLMVLFEQSKNWEFRIKGTPMTDVVTGVDWDNMMVIGRTYGKHHVSLCELKGTMREQNDTLN